MKREKMVDVQAQRDEYRKQSNVAECIVNYLAMSVSPDAEDLCAMSDGAKYCMRVFGVTRSHGGVILISYKGASGTEAFSSKYFDDALIEARKTATSSPESRAYRDAFDRLERKVRTLQEQTA